MNKNNKKIVKRVTFKNVKAEPSNFKIYLISIITVILTILVFKVYNFITYIPERPNVDLDSWWGPNSSRKYQDKSIRPYRIIFPESALNKLVKKFELYRVRNHVESFNNTQHACGLNSNVLNNIFDVWRYKYNIKEREKYFNKYEHFLTNIEGLDVHFVRVKPQVEENVKVYQLLLLHGWPGSFKEFYRLIPTLTSKQKEYDFVFEVIVPSLPGFGYSQSPIKPGLSPLKIAVIINKLMERIGIESYYIQAGDLGHIIGTYIATMYPNKVLGFHGNNIINFNINSGLVWFFSGLLPNFIIEKPFEDKTFPFSERVSVLFKEFAYLHLQATKPDSLGVALQDSPLGLAAYILEKYLTLSEPKLSLEDSLQKYSITDLLDNIMVYWFTSSIITSMRIYVEIINDWKAMSLWSRIPTNVPTWSFRTKHHLIQQPDFILRWKYTKFVGSTYMDKGGHYPAMEMPDRLASDVFQAVNLFRKYHRKLY